MAKIQIKGTIISNDDKWFYDWFDIEATCPNDIVLPENGEDVEVYINSGGGDVYAGSEIYTLLREYTGKVTVKVVGIAASAASVIAMAGDRVEMSPTAQMMIHNVWSVAQGDSKAFSKESEVLEGFNHSLAGAYLAKTGKSKEELLALMDAETWFTAEQAVTEGFADAVMFSESQPMQLVASQSVVIPKACIETMRKSMANQNVDLDRLADLVAERLKVQNTVVEASSKEGLGRFCF